MPQAGGTPREILEDVLSADWSRDGQTLAAIQAAVGEYQIHFPTGNPIYTSTNKLGHLRFSPGGDRLAFIEYALVSDETGVVKAIDLHGTTTTVSRSFHQIRDLSWSPDGREILVSASEQARDARIHAISLAGSHRLLMHVPGPVFVHDVAPDGRALVTHGSARARILWSSGNEQREVSWLDWSTVADISADGTTVLFYEWGQAVKGEPTVFLRSSNGADAVGLGDGKALALSPDKRWALALQESPKPHLVLLPTGAGTSRQLSAGELTDLYWARWFPDGRRLLVVGEDDKGAPGSYVQEIESGQISPIAEKGLLAVLVAPDGTRVLVNDPLEGFLIWPVGNGEPQRLSALDPKHWPIQWSADGKFLYTRRTEGTSVRIHRFNLATGRSDLVKELAPHEGDGVVGVSDGRGELAITPDGTTAVFTYWTFVRDLFLVEPLWP
jgi:dipeptidyl aminopeptidase/acylaminoacyl peptidase